MRGDCGSAVVRGPVALGLLGVLLFSQRMPAPGRRASAPADAGRFGPRTRRTPRSGISRIQRLPRRRRDGAESALACRGSFRKSDSPRGRRSRRATCSSSIDPRETTAALKRAEADKAKAAAEATNARSEEARAKRLVQNRNLSEEEYQSKLSAKESAEAAVKQSEAAVEAAQIQLGYTEIKSPIDGRISRTLVTRGNIVGINEPTLLTTIVSLDPLFVYFDIPERDLVSFVRDERTQRIEPSRKPDRSRRRDGRGLSARRQTRLSGQPRRN